MRLVARIGKGRMVYDDAQLAAVVFQKLPCFIDRCYLTVFIGHHNVAHGGSDIASDEDRGVFDVNALPTFQGETGILGEIGVTADKVSQRAVTGGSESLRCLR